MARAAYSAIAAASNTPLSPVQALALPLLTMMARATPDLTWASESSTGAARTRFLREHRRRGHVVLGDDEAEVGAAALLDAGDDAGELEAGAGG